MNKQKGVALPVALILFVVMLVGALYVARSSSSAALMAGNLSYQLSLSRAADAGLLTANNWLATTHDNAGTVAQLDTDQAAQGYVSAFAVAVPPASQLTPEDAAFWVGSRTLVNVDLNGTNVEYIIYRMCSQRNVAIAANNCIMTDGSSGWFTVNNLQAASTQIGQSAGVGNQNVNSANLAHYLITARVTNGQRGISVVNQLVVMMGA